jgi:hypothetical protein
MVVITAHNRRGLDRRSLCRLAGAPTRVRRRRNRLFASPSMERCSTLRHNRIIPATTTTRGSLDQIPATDFLRSHRTGGHPLWSITRRRSGTSCRRWTLRPDTSNRTHSHAAKSEGAITRHPVGANRVDRTCTQCRIAAFRTSLPPSIRVTQAEPKRTSGGTAEPREAPAGESLARAGRRRSGLRAPRGSLADDRD